MKIAFCIVMYLVAFSAVGVNAQTERLKESKSVRSYFGNYKAYRWADEAVTEMTYAEANNLLHKKMSIKQNMFLLFSNAIQSPNYKLSFVNRDNFFSDFKVDKKLFKTLKDTIKILSVTVDDSFDEKRVIISGNDLIVNYRGYFYFFLKSSER